MGIFLLEKQSTPLEAELIIGGSRTKLDYILARASWIRVPGREVLSRLQNRGLARFIAENAYREGEPIHTFSQKRRFLPEHYKHWARWATRNELNIAGFNFPLAVPAGSEEFMTMTSIIVEAQNRTHISQTRMKAELGPALEERIFGQEPFRFGCKGSSIIYHRDDVNAVIKSLFTQKIAAAGAKKDGDPTNTCFIPGWYSPGDISNILREQDSHTNARRVTLLIEALAQEGYRIPAKCGRRASTILYVTEETFRLLQGLNADYDPHAFRQRISTFIRVARGNDGPQRNDC